MKPAFLARILLLLALAAPGGSPAAAAVVDDGRPISVTFAGASAQGYFAVIGEGLAEMVRRQYPGSAVNYEPGSNAGALMRALEGDAEFCFLSQVMARQGERGAPPFSSKLPIYERIRTIFPPATMVAYVVARDGFLEKHGVRTLEDVRRKRAPMRIALNQKGNVEVYHTARALLEAYGMTEKDVTAWGGKVFYVPSATYTEMIKDAKLDVVITMGYYPDRRIHEMQQATPVRLLEIAAPVLDALAAQFGMDRAAIPRGTYDFLAADYPTVSMTLWTVAGPQASDPEVYKFTKAVYRNLDYFRKLHPMFHDYPASRMAGHGPFRLHPAAAQLYREVGLLDASGASP